MPRLSHVAVFALSTVVLLGLALPARAQLFSARGERAVHSVSFGYYLIDFTFDGDEEPVFSFDFEEPAYGLVYTRPRFMATFGIGDQSAQDDRERLRLLDASLTTWAPLFRRGLGPSQDAQVYIPVVLFSHYRRVASRGSGDGLTDAFNVTVFGLGTGLGLGVPLSEHAGVEARVNPIIGLASSSLADAFGNARLLDADVQVHLGRLFGKMGLSLGYSYRVQIWNVNASDLFPDFTDELFDYRGTQHIFRAGVNW